MRVVVYCTTKSEAESLAATLKAELLLSGEDKVRVLDWFRYKGDAVLVTTLTAACTGWRAPAGTMILFSPSCEHTDGRVLQARARPLPTQTEVRP